MEWVKDNKDNKNNKDNKKSVFIPQISVKNAFIEWTKKNNHEENHSYFQLSGCGPLQFKTKEQILEQLKYI